MSAIGTFVSAIVMKPIRYQERKPRTAVTRLSRNFDACHCRKGSKRVRHVPLTRGALHGGELDKSPNSHIARRDIKTQMLRTLLFDD